MNEPVLIISIGYGEIFFEMLGREVYFTVRCYGGVFVLSSERKIASVMDPYP